MNDLSLRKYAASLFRHVQSDICTSLEAVDTGSKFVHDPWTRSDSGGGHGGGGVSCVLRGDGIFEQAGVNFSEVYGTLVADMAERLIGERADVPFYATGVSLVIHPRSPMVPTTHANYRYLEVGSKSWFGGGGDLTPYYLFEEDAHHFHRTLREQCDRHGAYFPSMKAACDEYFFLPHRQETRGIGGIFFDYFGREGAPPADEFRPLVEELANGFLDTYVPIVSRRKDELWGDRERAFQLIRRGRYVEFNLLYDRGTLFGLKTGGRTESILMSLPPTVRWEYNYVPEPRSREAALLAVLQAPRSWGDAEKQA